MHNLTVLVLVILNHSQRGVAFNVYFLPLPSDLQTATDPIQMNGRVSCRKYEALLYISIEVV